MQVLQPSHRNGAHIDRYLLQLRKSIAFAENALLSMRNHCCQETRGELNSLELQTHGLLVHVTGRERFLKRLKGSKHQSASSTGLVKTARDVA